jgi:hypothetical protein
MPLARPRVGVDSSLLWTDLAGHRRASAAEARPMRPWPAVATPADAVMGLWEIRLANRCRRGTTAEIGAAEWLVFAMAEGFGLYHAWHLRSGG